MVDAWPPQEWVDAIYREKVEHARRMSADQKLSAGPELFDLGCELMLAGVRMQYPGASLAEWKAKVRDRIEFARKRDER